MKQLNQHIFLPAVDNEYLDASHDKSHDDPEQEHQEDASQVLDTCT